MKQKFTPEDLVKYLYSETTATERLEIDEALSQNISLREEYESLLQACQQLPKVAFSPSGYSVHNILKYSEMTTLEKQA